MDSYVKHSPLHLKPRLSDGCDEGHPCLFRPVCRLDGNRIPLSRIRHRFFALTPKSGMKKRLTTTLH